MSEREVAVEDVDRDVRGRRTRVRAKFRVGVRGEGVGAGRWEDAGDRVRAVDERVRNAIERSDGRAVSIGFRFSR
jgi:hypothetical protein